MMRIGPTICDATDGSCPDGCTMETGGCKGTVFRREHAVPHIQALAEALIRDAELYGVVVTIDLAPLKPLAMGHHVMVASARHAREMAK